MQKSRFFLLFFCFYSLSFSQQKTVGVLSFTNNSLAERENMQPLAQGLADMISTGLSAITSLTIVERAKFQSILTELALSQSGAIDESSAKQAGRMAGADILLLGSFSLGFDNTVRIDARLVNVETGTTIRAEEVTGPKKKIFDLVARLNFKLACELAPAMSKFEKKAIAAKDNASFNALVIYSKGMAAEASGDTTTARESYNRALELNKNYRAAQKRLAALSSGASR